MIFASRLSLDLSLARALFCSDLGATGRCLLLVGFRPRTLGTRSLFMGGRTRVLGGSLALCGLLAELPSLLASSPQTSLASHSTNHRDQDQQQDSGNHNDDHYCCAHTSCVTPCDTDQTAGRERLAQHCGQINIHLTETPNAGPRIGRAASRG